MGYDASGDKTPHRDEHEHPCFLLWNYCYKFDVTKSHQEAPNVHIFLDIMKEISISFSALVRKIRLWRLTLSAVRCSNHFWPATQG